MVLITILVIFQLFSEELFFPERLPGNYEVNHFPIDRVEPEDRIQGNLRDINFEEKTDFFVWLADSIIGEASSAGINIGWNYNNLLLYWKEEIRSELEEDAFEVYDNNTLKSLLGLKGGWFLHWQITDKLRFQPEINYRKNNSQLNLYNFSLVDTSLPDTKNQMKISAQVHYLEIPLLMKYQFVAGNDSAPHLSLGMATNIYLDGDAKWKYEAEDIYAEDIYTQSGDVDLGKLQGLTFSILSGIGFSYEKLIFVFYYEVGLSRINKPSLRDFLIDTDGEVGSFLLNAWGYKQHTISFTVDYNFAGD